MHPRVLIVSSAPGYCHWSPQLTTHGAHTTTALFVTSVILVSSIIHMEVYLTRSGSTRVQSTLYLVNKMVLINTFFYSKEEEM